MMSSPGSNRCVSPRRARSDRSSGVQPRNSALSRSRSKAAGSLAAGRLDPADNADDSLMGAGRDSTSRSASEALLRLASEPPQPALHVVLLVRLLAAGGGGVRP